MSTTPLKIAIAGTGYVDLSSGVLLVQHNNVMVANRLAGDASDTKEKVVTRDFI